MLGVKVLLLGVGIGVLGVVVTGVPSDLLPCFEFGIKSTLLPTERVSLQTPDYPGNYPSNKRCQWTIECSPKDSTFLKIICRRFSLGAGDHLLYKHAGIDDKLTQGGSLTTDITPSGWVNMTFTSDDEKESTGFRCFIWCHSKPADKLPPTPKFSKRALPLTPTTTGGGPTTSTPPPTTSLPASTTITTPPPITTLTPPLTTTPPTSTTITTPPLITTTTPPLTTTPPTFTTLTTPPRLTATSSLPTSTGYAGGPPRTSTTGWGFITSGGGSTRSSTTGYGSTHLTAVGGCQGPPTTTTTQSATTIPC